MANDKYGSKRKYSTEQLARISELRTRLGMGDASQDEVAAMAKRLGIKGFKKGGPAAPIMPEEVKKRRKKRSMAQDTTEKPPRSAYKAMGFTDAELKKMGMMYGGKVKKMANGGAVMAGRGGKFKGIS